MPNSLNNVATDRSFFFGALLHEKVKPGMGVFPIIHSRGDHARYEILSNKNH